MHDAVHLSWAAGPEDIELVGDLGDVVASGWNFRRYFLGVETAARSSGWWDM